MRLLKKFRKLLNYMRIISLVPSLTETICDLKLQSFLVGRTKFCISPKNLYKTVPAVGGTKDPDVENIVSLNPTHILINTEENTIEIRELLRNHENLRHVVFYESFPKNIDDSISMVEELGSIFKKESVALDWKEKIQSLLAELKSKQFSKKYFAYFIWREPWMTAGQKTYISQMLSLFGLENVIKTEDDLRERYPIVEALDERLLKADILFFSSEPFPFKKRHVQELHSINPLLINKKCDLIDGRLLSWYGTCSLPAIKYLLKYIDK